MGTAILRSQDCLRNNRFHPETLTPSPFKPPRNPNPHPNSIRPRRRKRSPVGSQDQENRRGDVRDRKIVVKIPAKDLVMEHVTILKRGEELKPARNLGFGVGVGQRRVRMASDEDLVLCSTDRLGPEPEMVQKDVDGLYAGSAFFASPPPSSLPFPAFFDKKNGESARTDAATSDLRRLLRLDLL